MVTEEVKKNRKTLITIAIGIGALYYISKKYALVDRKSFKTMCNMLLDLQNRGYIRFVNGPAIQIVDGLVPPIVG